MKNQPGRGFGQGDRARRWRLATTAVLVFLAFGAVSRAQPAQKPPEAAVLAKALDDFTTVLAERWAYRGANAADFEGATARLRRKLVTGMSIDQFGLELHKILALGIDGHSSVMGYQLPGKDFLPFLIESSGQQLVGFQPDRRAFLAEGFPYVTSLDGRELSEWLSAAAVIVPKGSPQYVRHRCLVRLGNLAFLREQLGLPQKETVSIEVQSADSGTRRTLTLPVGKALPVRSQWPRDGSRVLAENIGYLRLTNMSRTAVPEIKEWMPRFRGTAGLIIDVRDNAGGRRDALPLIYSYLAAPDEVPRVCNAAVYRLHPTNKEDHLADDHFMYRAHSPVWTKAEKAAIAGFAKDFRPQWDFPRGQFSAWHYLALRRPDEKGIYHYRRPVVILMNARCFSATDIFLAGLKGMKNVTLMGTPSSGGSAATQEFPLGATPLSIGVASMISFQANGRLFDGWGVEPDVAVEPNPDYFIGGRDNVLEEARRLLTGGAPGR